MVLLKFPSPAALPSDEMQPYSLPILLPDADVSGQPQTPKWRSTPLTSGSTLLSFDAALAKEIGETKAIILQKVWDWMEYNRIEGNFDHFIDGQWYSYNSAKQWRDKHFTHLSVITIKKAFQELEKEGLLYRAQFRKPDDDHRQWVTIPAEARARIDAISSQNTPDKKYLGGDKKYPGGDKKYPGGDKKYPHTTTESQIENLQIKNQIKKPKGNQQQQLLQTPDVELKTISETDVVVVVAPLPPREPESITGEHSIDGEGPQSVPPSAPHGSALVKAMHRDNANDQEPSKVPLKVSRLAEKLRDEMGFMAGLAETLIRKHGAGRIRAIAKYIESQGSAIHTPPAYMRHELEFNELCLGFDDDESWDSAKRFASTANLSEPQPLTDYVAERIEELAAREFVPPLPQPVGWNERPGGGMTAGEIWKTAHHQLSLLFDRPSYDMWLRDARFIGFDASSTTFTIGVPSAHAQEMLQHRYYRNVHRVIEGLGNTPLTLVFEVSASTSLDISQQPLSASERDELHRLRELRTLV